MADMEAFDLVIIGAGIHGIAMLKTYREVNPAASIAVLDKGTAIGGVWAKDRLYPGLSTNNHFQTFEYSDHRMNTEGFNLKDDHIPGEHVNEYLNDYVEKFDLLKYMRFQCSVDRAVDDGPAGWTLTVINRAVKPDETKQIKAAKLIVATGLTSEPFMPKLPGKETFGAPIYHTSEFAKASDGLGPYKQVTLLSGAKFAWDIACAYASAGVHVNWVIRESGHGPCWMSPNRLTPLKVIPELLLQTRLVTWLSPCIWGDADGFAGIRKFLHQHWLGRKIVDGFFAKMEHSIKEANNYHAHPETAKLEPWDDVFYIGTNRGLLNYGDIDFFELVRSGKISVHIADITHLSAHTVHLSSGQDLESDILICGTGWKDAPPINFHTSRELGLPGHTSPSSWKFIPRADAEILSRCPKLRNQPTPKYFKPQTDDEKIVAPEPYRLYRFMVPPAFIDDKTLAFAGAYRSPSTTIISQVQALWITAFLTNSIPAFSTALSLPEFSSAPDAPLPDDSQVTLPLDSDTALTPESTRILYETVLHTQFGKWRYCRGFGARFPEMWFDCLPYIDMLLTDVGVRNHRKDSWWNERFTPYWPRDYKGIVGEFLGLKAAKDDK